MLDNAYRSGPHRKVEQVLEQLGMSYISEETSFPPYQLDIYLPDYHACIEIDGPGHLKRKDEARDHWMMERFGVPTLRIKAKGPWASKGKIQEQVMGFLEENAGNFKERKLRWQRQML